MIIWVGASGHLDDVPVASIRAFEQEFYTFMRNRYPQVGKAVREKRELTDEIVSGLKKATEEFKNMFSAR
jgi:F-type H+-transporting ATPase subunit alpha